MNIRAFITHKQAELFADCQDRFGVNSGTKSIAVSDGMGSTWQQKIWAQLLVDNYIQSDTWNPNLESIKPLCSLWRSQVEAFIQHLKETNAPLNMVYRNERNLAEGRSAGATFVGIRFNGNKWNGSVLGDSCLIEWNGTGAKFHTSQDVEAFDSYPDYFDSDASKEGKGIPKDINGELAVGEYLFLVSDPFSEFLLEHSKKGDIAHYVQQLLALSSHDDFEALVGDWRKEGMHNDDTTLVIVENDNSADFSTQEQDDINSYVETEKLEKENQQEIVSEQIIQSAKEDKVESGAQADESLIPIDPNVFIHEFLSEYKSILIQECKILKDLKFKATEKAARKTLNKLFENYSVVKKEN